MPIVGWDVKSPFGYLTARPTTLAEYRERVMASVSASVDKLMQHDLKANEVEGVRGEGRGVIDLSYIPRSMLSQALVVVLDTLGARAAELLPRLVIVRTFR